MQLLTGSPFNRTVHAPHSPAEQPFFVPVNARLSRSKRMSGQVGWHPDLFKTAVDRQTDFVESHVYLPASCRCNFCQTWLSAISVKFLTICLR